MRPIVIAILILTSKISICPKNENLLNTLEELLIYCHNKKNPDTLINYTFNSYSKVI